MINIFYFTVLILTSYGIGKRCINFLIDHFEYVLEDFIFSTGIGLGILGYTVYIVGSLSALYPQCIAVILFLYAALAVNPVEDILRRADFTLMIKSVYHLSAFEKFLLFIIIAIPCICLFGALAPEIGNDALAYHIYHPKIFVQTHHIGYVPYTRESLWPYLTEMLFTLGLLFRSVAISKLFHYFFGILSVLSVYSLVRRFFGKKEALLSSVLFYSAPGIFMQSVYAYVDLSLCFYSLAALYAMLIWNDKRDVKYIVLAGLFTGLALSVKLLGIFTFAALLGIIFYTLARDKNKFSLFIRYSLILFAVSLSFSFIWYLRSYLILNNPVYPFLHTIFYSGWQSDLGRDYGVQKNILGILRIMWDLVMSPASFGSEQIGVIALAFLPFVLFVPVKDKKIMSLFVFLCIYLALWFIVDQNVRFAFVVFAVIYILIGIGFCKAAKLYRLNVTTLIMILCILFNLSICFYHNFDPLKVVLGFTSEEKYLLKKERSYPIAKFVNENIPKNSELIVTGEPCIYYFDRNTLIYDIWKAANNKDINLYINGLKNANKPVYLLYRDDAPYPEIKKMTSGKALIRSFVSNVDLGKQATYYLYKM